MQHELCHFRVDQTLGLLVRGLVQRNELQLVEQCSQIDVRRARQTPRNRLRAPRELARCQGFPDDYILTGNKTSQVARIGNSVCPQVAEALVRANYAEE